MMWKYSNGILFCGLLSLLIILTNCRINFYNPFVESTFKSGNSTTEIIPTPEPPVPGNSGLITVTSHTETSITFSWTEATDPITAAANLLYKVVRSDFPNIDTPANAEANGTIITDWTAVMNNALASSLTAGSLYYLNIIVMNETGKTAVYAMHSGATNLPSDTTTLTAFYPFNGNAIDESVNTSDLTVSEAVLTTNRENQANKAYAFDPTTGNLDYLWITNPPGIVFTSEMTISVWVYVNDNMSDQKILGETVASATAGYVMGIENGSIKHEIWDTTAVRYVVTTGAISQGAWHHLALTWKTNGKMRSYIDGALTEEINASANNIGFVADFFRIGCAPWDTSFAGFDGKIDDIRLYTEELTAGDIASLYSYPAD